MRPWRGCACSSRESPQQPVHAGAVLMARPRFDEDSRHILPDADLHAGQYGRGTFGQRAANVKLGLAREVRNSSFMTTCP